MQTRKWKHRHPQKRFSREERKEQILGQFGIWLSKGDTEPKTMNRIARALGMSPAQNVTDILLELCQEGKLTWQEREKSGRWTARGFLASPTLEPYHEKYAKRRIVVKHNGKIAGQLELAL